MVGISVERPTQIISVTPALFFENYMLLAATSLYCYDYCLTFDREVKFFWGRRPSLAATLFFTFRYAALLNTIPEIWALCSRTLTEQSCTALLLLEAILDVLVLVSTAIFAALRVYAIYRRSQLAFGVVLVSGLAAPAVVIYVSTRSKIVFSLLPHFRVCTLGILGGTQSYECCTFRMMAASVLSHGVILFLTCLKTMKSRREFRVAPFGQRATLREILLCDTALSFGFLCALGVAGMATGRLEQFLQIWDTWTYM